VTTGASIAAFGPSGRWEPTVADAAVEVFDVFTGSGLLLPIVGALGCDFHNHPRALELTETEKAIAVVRATTEINSVAIRFVLVSLEYLRRVRRINPGPFSSRGIRNSF
jgi:hypothetical protein